jgi:hypothetical protein
VQVKFARRQCKSKHIKLITGHVTSLTPSGSDATTLPTVEVVAHGEDALQHRDEVLAVLEVLRSLAHHGVGLSLPGGVSGWLHTGCQIGRIPTAINSYVLTAK